VRDALPGPDVWLVLRRHVETQELKTSLCHAPADTPVETHGRMSGMRWPIATCFEDGKQLLVVSLDCRDETHPNARTGTRWHAIDPGMLPRCNRTVMYWSPRHDR